MGNTYTKIAETRNEWQRQVRFSTSLSFLKGILWRAFLLLQNPLFINKLMLPIFIYKWARIVLVVERGVDPKARLENQRLYSQPMVDGRRAFVIRQQQSVS